MQLSDLCHFCHQYLEVDEFSDYCPNGLQVEGRPTVNRLVSGVTASLDLIDAAIELDADAILVHHGYFWKGEAQPIVGFKGRRIRRLMQNDISLLAYHLPLDAHPVVGNNAQLAQRLGWAVTGQHDLVWTGELAEETDANRLLDDIGDQIDANPLLISAGSHPVKTLAWCTGGAQSYIEQAAELEVDLFVSGEISEHTVHFAREMGVHYIAAGHHATERYGVQALGDLLSERFDLYHEYVEIDNPA